MTAPTDDLRYPVGRFHADPTFTAADRTRLIDELAAAPGLLREAVAGLNDEQLDTPYRPDGWTVRQVVHHVPDSHLNSYIRFKWALTEDSPTIKAYHEERWAEVHEGRDGDIEMSLTLLDALHVRWLTLLRAMTPEEWAKELGHPDHDAMLSLDWMLQLYAWHSRHHVAHITHLREQKGW